MKVLVLVARQARWFFAETEATTPTPNSNSSKPPKMVVFCNFIAESRYFSPTFGEQGNSPSDDDGWRWLAESFGREERGTLLEEEEKIEF